MPDEFDPFDCVWAVGLQVQQVSGITMPPHILVTAATLGAGAGHTQRTDWVAADTAV